MENILGILEQLKKFVIQERWSYFTLFIYILFGITFINWYLPLLSENTSLNINLFYINLWTTIIIIAYWLVTRRLGSKKKLVNIGIGQMDILNISTTEHLDAEQKLQISSEVTNYIYNRLSHTKQSLKLDKHLNFLKLQPRIKIDYANNENIARKLWIDTIIRGTIRYDKEKIYINTKLAFNKEINSIFFQKLINDLNAYPEIDFDFSSAKNLEFDKFIHEVTYLSIIYRSLELINNFEYKEAEKLLLDGIYKLNKLYENKEDQSVNKGDREVSKIELLMYFILSKNYFNRANSLLGDFDYKNLANEKLEKSGEAINKQLEIMKKYINDIWFDELEEKVKLENAYMNAMSKLGKSGNKKVLESQLKKVESFIENKQKHDMVKALIESRFKNFADAKRHYESGLKEDPNNTVILRWLWLIEFEEKNRNKSREYFQRLYKITSHYIFDDHLYDLLVQDRLIKLSIKKHKIKNLFEYIFNYISFSIKNKKTRKRTYILKSF